MKKCGGGGWGGVEETGEGGEGGLREKSATAVLQVVWHLSDV